MSLLKPVVRSLEDVEASVASRTALEAELLEASDGRREVILWRHLRDAIAKLPAAQCRRGREIKTPGEIADGLLGLSNDMLLDGLHSSQELLSLMIEHGGFGEPAVRVEFLCCSSASVRAAVAKPPKRVRFDMSGPDRALVERVSNEIAAEMEASSTATGGHCSASSTVADGHCATPLFAACVSGHYATARLLLRLECGAREAEEAEAREAAVHEVASPPPSPAAESDEEMEKEEEEEEELEEEGDGRGEGCGDEASKTAVPSSYGTWQLAQLQEERRAERRAERARQHGEAPPREGITTAYLTQLFYSPRFSFLSSTVRFEQLAAVASHAAETACLTPGGAARSELPGDRPPALEMPPHPRVRERCRCSTHLHQAARWTWRRSRRTARCVGVLHG